MRFLVSLLFILVSLGSVADPSLWSQQSLDYKQRGDHYEGIRPRPVAGEDIELISALIDHDEGTGSVPDRLRIKFFLRASERAFVTVREQDYKYYYWLDRVSPQNKWRPGFENEFVWSTGTVLRQLDQHFPIEDLGVLVRLNKESPSEPEQVAPVILYHTQNPQVVRGYLFTLKPASDTHMSCSVYREGADTPLVTQGFKKLLGGRPFTMKWDAQHASEGSYNLQCRGYFLDNSNPVAQTVRFYHRPSVP